MERSVACFNERLNGNFVLFIIKTKKSISDVDNYFKSSLAPPCRENIKITGPATVYEGDNIILTCKAGPSYPGNHQIRDQSITTFIMMVLEIILTWKPENIGWNVTNKSEKYLPNSNDPRMETSSNIIVKVKDKM